MHDAPNNKSSISHRAEDIRLEYAAISSNSDTMRGVLAVRAPRERRLVRVQDVAVIQILMYTQCARGRRCSYS